MKSRILLTLLLFLVICKISATQEFYKVNAKELNIRSGAGKQFSAVGSVYQDEIIKGDTSYNGWLSITTNKGAHGFVSNQFVSLQQSYSQEDFAKSSNTDFSVYYPWIFIAFICLVLYFIYRSYKKRCKQCGKWNAMVESDSEVVSREQTNIKKTLTDVTRDSKGQAVRKRSKEVYIPGTKTRYRITETCKYCQHERQFYKNVTREN